MSDNWQNRHNRTSREFAENDLTPPARDVLLSVQATRQRVANRPPATTRRDANRHPQTETAIMSHDVKSIAIATTRASRKILVNRIAVVESELNDCVDNDGSDRQFFRLCGRRDELAGEYLESFRFERSLESARPEALALLTQHFQGR